MKKMFKFFQEIVLIIFLIFFVIIASFLKTNQGFFGYLFFTVNSGSMEPSIKTGSFILVKKQVNPVFLKKGEIITFKDPRQPDRLITHRILEIKKTSEGKYFFVTKGDANKTIDRWQIPFNLVIGKTIFSFPYLGFLISFIKQPLGFVIFILLPASFIVFLEIKKIIDIFGKKIKKDDTKIIPALFCLFVFLINISSTVAQFSSNGENKNNYFSSRCWENPSLPTLISPANEAITNNHQINFTWNPSTSSCPTATLSYRFQLDDNENFTTPLVNSSFSDNLNYLYNNLPEGQYWWRVQVQDQYNNLSTSQANHLIIDYTPPPSVSLLISNSWTKAIEEKISNGDFEIGNLQGWHSAGNVNIISTDTINDASPLSTVIVTPVSGLNMVLIGKATHDIAEDELTFGNYLWKNRLMTSFDSGIKGFSLYYNFFSRDYHSFDNPGFLIRLNGQEIFNLNTLIVNPNEETDKLARFTGWNEFYYDLSNYNDEKINLIIYAGNTGDFESQSWVYIDKVTTYFVSASSHALYTLTGNDNIGGSGINHYQYKIDNFQWSIGNNFYIQDEGVHILQYRSVDNAGNYSPIYTVRVIIDDTSPSQISDLSISSTTSNSITLTWTAPGNDQTIGRASQYDIRYSKTLTDCSTFNFDAATKVEKVLSPQDSGKTETLEILGLNPETKYCFAIKTADEAPNWSEISNIVLGETNTGLTINPGDVVINELMWMGSSVSPADEWLELRNMTERTIDLTNFYLTKFNGTSESVMNINFHGKTIPPYGYFLIANGNNYAGGDSQLKNTVIPDIWDTSLDLSDSTLQIKLYWNDGVNDHLIDAAWDRSVPGEGYYEAGLKYYSMERVSTPGDGTNPLNWYTCIDQASTNEFFDGDADERGTPKAPNRSENEPLAHQSLINRSPSSKETKSPINPTPLSTITTQPELIVNISNDYKTLSFNVKNLIKYIKLLYELTYESDSGLQGIIGEADLNNQEEFVKNNLILGTCSSGGTCIYHSGIKNIQLKIDLKDKNNNIHSLFQLIN